MASIEPLRINKGTPTSSPAKNASALSPRPLSEISPSERRRNSPSFNQATKKSYLDSSPLDTSPFASKFNISPFTTNSPLAYWQNRDSRVPENANHENQDPNGSSPNFAKRPSVENLKKASRVKNSSIFAREQKLEYDPASTTLLDRPLAAGRPFNSILPKSLWGKKADVPKSAPVSPIKPKDMPSMNQQDTRELRYPQHHQGSPTKSSLSRATRYGDGFDDTGIASDEEDIVGRQLPSGKSLRRHAKSVTFTTAPPEINEYEMTTPDPSSVASGSREGSYESQEDEEEDEFYGFQTNPDDDDSFDASLEDTDKTPVVLPEQWRFLSPDNISQELASKFEDPFEMRKSPAIGVEPVVTLRPSPSRTDSIGSNGERRPLPPLPPQFPRDKQQRSPSPGSLESVAESVATTQKSTQSTLQAASVSKDELRRLSSASMSLDDRLRLMMLQQDGESTTATKSAADEQRERRMRRAGASPDRSQTTKSDFHIHEDEQPQAEELLADIPKPSMISRESILRKVKDQARTDDFHGSAEASLSPRNHSSLPVDPDFPIPSLEDGTQLVTADDGMIIKQEEDDDAVDLSAIPEAYASISGFEPTSDRQTSHDSGSHYSQDSNDHKDMESPPTPKASTQTSNLRQEDRGLTGMALPQFPSMLDDNDFSSSFSQYTAKIDLDSQTAYEPTTDISYTRKLETVAVTHTQIFDPFSVQTGVEAKIESDRESSADSVIRHPIYSSDEEDAHFTPPVIPESKASIKAPGGLKTRASLAPADMATMAETRRKVSGDHPAIPSVPPRHKNRPSVILEGDSFIAEDNSATNDGSAKQAKRKSSLLALEVPSDLALDLSSGINQEFDRVMEASKKGYLMRQNTKLIVASSGSHESTTEVSQEMPPPPRSTRSAGNSPVKGSATWTTEPWNGRIRRKSIRHSGGGAMMKLGVAPPLPGMLSNVTCDTQEPEETVIEEGDEFEDGQERGRLFVKVVGVKDLDMPLPRDERSYFCLTLDNGLHCVTTSWLELGRNAPIGQEFELVVLNDLEFQLTLQTKLEEPKPLQVSASPSKLQKPKTSAFSRVFASPKKRKEQELREREEHLARQKALDNARPKSPTAWDLLHNLVGKDGSFARAYISLKDHEAQAFGRPFTVDIPCFNEWAMEEVRNVGSARSGRSVVGGMQRRAPYKLAKLELQLLYVPKPKDATDEDMPKSMNACVREMQEAARAADQSYEGHLSQQGGDCPYWRRRFFRLEGSKLTAYHEATRQPRATINLAKASRLIDDKSSLTQKEVSGKGGARRRSAFAQEEEGYMFVEEGFRIRFANGEVIDFYADKTADKEGWMKVLAEVVGKESAKSSKNWTAIVLKKERMLAAQAVKNDSATAPSSPTKSSHLPSSNIPFSKSIPGQPTRPGSSLDKPLPGETTRGPTSMTPAERREKAKTMLF